MQILSAWGDDNCWRTVKHFRSLVYCNFSFRRPLRRTAETVIYNFSSSIYISLVFNPTLTNVYNFCNFLHF